MKEILFWGEIMKTISENRFGKCVMVPTPEDYGGGNLLEKLENLAINSPINVDGKGLKLVGRSTNITLDDRSIRTSVSFFLE